MNKTALLMDTGHFLNRPRLNRLLNDAIQKPLTTVIAGAGYGKTQAVSSVLASASENVVWFQLTDIDNFVGGLWIRIINAFEPYSHSLADSLRSLDFPNTASTFNQFLRLMEMEVLNKGRFILVLDDFQLMHDKIILNFFEQIISARVHNLSIVIISRTKPNLSLVGMLSKGLLARITEEDLRFSKDEMEIYYQAQGVDLSESMISDIYDKTEGWIFAIYLVGLSVKKGNFKSRNPISSAKVDIFDLIEKEIFSTASKELQNFMITISILDNVPVNLAKELSDNNPFIVSEMMAISLFIYYDSYSDGYRMHHLFREFLLERKNTLTEKEVHNIYLEAARWYENNKQLVEAANYYQKCNCYNEIFDIILSVKRSTVKEVADGFIGLIEQAPEEIIQVRPIMLVVRARYLLHNNRIAESYEELVKLRIKYEALPPTKENITVLGEVYTILGIISLVLVTLDFVELFRMADECLPNGSAIINNTVNLVGSTSYCLMHNPVPGEVQRYIDAFFEAMPYASRVMNGCGFGLEYLVAAESSYLTGDIINAEKNAYEAIYRAEQQQQVDIELMSYLVLIRAYMSKGNFIKIKDILEKLEIKKVSREKYLTIYDITEAKFFVDIERFDKIAKWIISGEKDKKKHTPVIITTDYLVLCFYYLKEGRYNEILNILEPITKIYRSRNILIGLIRNYNLEALTHYYMGDHEDAIQILQASYELSYANNIIMPYIELGSKISSLIQIANQDEECEIPKEWLDNIYTKATIHAKQVAGIAFEYNVVELTGENKQVDLSKREVEILSYLCRGQTREEIAVNCFLSLSTVKNMLQNIYSKLGVQNSIDAVRVATIMRIV